MTLFIVIKKCPTVFAKSLKRILIFFFILLGKPLFHLLHPHLQRVRNCPGKKTFRRCFIPAPQVFCLSDWQTWECWGKHCDELFVGEINS